MASKKILVQLDIAAASDLTSPLGGFVGFSAKADGLYQKIGTSPELRLLTSADVQNAILADGSITGAVSQAQTFTLGVKLSNLTQGYIPYASGATKLLSNSPIYTDGTNVGIGITYPLAKLHIIQTDDNYRASIIERATTDLQNNGLLYLIGRSSHTGVFTRAAEITLINTNAIFNNYTSIVNMAANYSVNSGIDFINVDQLYNGAIRFNTRSLDGSYGERIRIDGVGNVGIGTISPTASLHIKAGTATVGTAPLKLTSGVNLATPESGTIEFSSSRLYFTPSSTRETIAFLSDITSASHAAVTLGAIGSAPNANGMSISGQTLSLQPASELYGGILTNSTQTIAGAKTFNENISGSGSNLLTNIIIDTHPESSLATIPFINNDIAYLTLRGGSVTANYGTPSPILFDGSPSYATYNNTDWATTMVDGYVIEATFHRAFTYSNKIGISFGNNYWRSNYIKVEVYRTDTSVWEIVGETSTNSSQIYQTYFNKGGAGITKMRLTFNDFNGFGDSSFRIAQIWLLSQSSIGSKEVFVGRDGGAMYGTLNLNNNILTNIGNVGTNFIASTGGLNLAGILTSNGGISNPSSYTQSGTSLNTFTGNIRNTSLTASKVVFTDGSKNLTSTGIGTASQFIKGDGSLDYNTYLTSGSISGFVPYTGANDDVNLGTHNLSCNEISTESTLTVGNTNTPSYTDGGFLRVARPGIGYASLSFYSKDTYNEFGVVQIYADPEEGISFGARTNDNSRNSDLRIGTWDIGLYTNSLKRLEITQSGSINAFGNTITSTGGFIGNASTATKLQTARTITIGNQSLSFDGTVNLTYSLANIGVLTGSGVDGRVTFWNGTNSLSSSSNLEWNNTTKNLTIVGGLWVNNVSSNSMSTNAFTTQGFTLGTYTTAGYVLTTDANGNGTWQAPGGSITGSGVSGRITFWNGTNSLSSTSDLEWNNTTKNLGVTGGIVANGVSSNSMSTNSLLTNSFSLIATTTAGYVLTTDAYGNGTWQAPTGSVSYTLPTATASVLGGVKIGSGITISSGIISVSTNYEAPLTFSSGLTRTGNTISFAGSSSYVPYTGANDNVNVGSYIIYANNFVLNSDINLKCNIESIEIKNIDIDYKKYEFKSLVGDIRYGVIAQELLKVAPELVSSTPNNTFSVKYIDLLIHEIAYLKQEIKKLTGGN